MLGGVRWTESAPLAGVLGAPGLGPLSLCQAEQRLLMVARWLARAGRILSIQFQYNTPQARVSSFV